jgi:hypothetical protein
VKEQHCQLVDKLLSEVGARRHSFKRAVRSELNLTSKDLESLEGTRIVPDGYLFDRDRQELICYEVETSSPINQERLSPYVDWWWVIDDFGWSLRLIVLRAYRSHGVAFEIDLPAVSLTWNSQASRIVGRLPKNARCKEARVAS